MAFAPFYPVLLGALSATLEHPLTRMRESRL